MKVLCRGCAVLAALVLVAAVARAGDDELPNINKRGESEKKFAGKLATAIVKAARADLWPAIETGKLSLPIDRTFPLAEAAQALAHMKANAHFGKIVLVV